MLLRSHKVLQRIDPQSGGVLSRCSQRQSQNRRPQLEFCKTNLKSLKPNSKLLGSKPLSKRAALSEANRFLRITKSPNPQLQCKRSSLDETTCCLRSLPSKASSLMRELKALVPKVQVQRQRNRRRTKSLPPKEVMSKWKSPKVKTKLKHQPELILQLKHMERPKAKSKKLLISISKHTDRFLLNLAQPSSEEIRSVLELLTISVAKMEQWLTSHGKTVGKTQCLWRKPYLQRLSLDQLGHPLGSFLPKQFLNGLSSFKELENNKFISEELCSLGGIVCDDELIAKRWFERFRTVLDHGVESLRDLSLIYSLLLPSFLVDDGWSCPDLRWKEFLKHSGLDPENFVFNEDLKAIVFKLPEILLEIKPSLIKMINEFAEYSGYPPIGYLYFIEVYDYVGFRYVNDDNLSLILDCDSDQWTDTEDEEPAVWQGLEDGKRLAPSDHGGFHVPVLRSRLERRTLSIAQQVLDLVFQIGRLAHAAKPDPFGSIRKAWNIVRRGFTPRGESFIGTWRISRDMHIFKKPDIFDLIFIRMMVLCRKTEP